MHNWAPFIPYLPTAVRLAEKAAEWYFNSKKSPGLV
jgi:hypothetical protein